MLRPSSPVEAIATFSSISSLTGPLRICIFVSVDYCASLPARLFLLVPGFGLTVKSAGTAPKKHFELAPNLTPLESTLLQLFILKNLKLFRINTGSVDILEGESMPQAVEVVGQAEQERLADLHRQATSRSPRGELTFDH